MTWQVVWSEHAIEEAARLDQRVRERVVKAVERLATTEQGDVKRLHRPEPEWRLRVGKWRVRFRFDAEDGTLTVLHVLPRDRAYRD